MKEKLEDKCAWKTIEENGIFDIKLRPRLCVSCDGYNKECSDYISRRELKKYFKDLK